MSAGDPIAEEVRALAALDLEGLRAAWGERLSEPLPKLRTAELLRLALAYRLQVRARGDLNGKTRRRMGELARKFAKDRSYDPSPAPVLKPGSSLIKAWRGERHEVRVLDDGFAYRGQRFGTLSEVARHITGTKWNGYVFFGLKARS